MDKSFWHKLYLSHQTCASCPSPNEVVTFFIDLLAMLFPDFTNTKFASETDFEHHITKLHTELERILKYNFNKQEEVTAAVNHFFTSVPSIYERISQDITAMYEGDPAAKSRSEVVRTYPGFYAIAAYRIAHVLNSMDVQVVPRIITEHAHSKTGIDIHPGAKIGAYFFIDHGTGVVIGETAIIGNYVKIYQGVTLGALSVSKEDAEKKRHPTIEDNVVVYAGATILGGETVIGHDSVVGGNVWLTRSVPPYSKIYYQAKMYNGDTEETDVVIFKPGKKGTEK